jgi:dipeptidyl-peptidase-4
MKYPKAGDPNPTVRLGILSIREERIQWADLEDYPPEDRLIVDVSWKPDSSQVVIQIQNRLQNQLDLILTDVDSGRLRRVLKETSEAWVNLLEPPYWLQDDSFLWLSERTGFRHLYHYSFGGKLLRAVTSGEWEVRDLEAIDEEQGCVYFSGTRDSHLENHLYRVGLDGRRLSRITELGNDHSVLFSPTFTHYIDTWSNVSTPPQVGVFDRRGSLVQNVVSDQGEVLEDYSLGETEFVGIQARDGFELSAFMITPPDFETGRKYPVLCHTYSGPHSHRMTSQKVRNTWGGIRYLWHQLLAQKGYMILVFDSRTASGKGVVSAWPVYRNLGAVELRDLEDILAWLSSKPFVDASRIGLWGWSYGGFLTAYALTHSEGLRLGIVGAPVTDWRLYDSIYTERYMGLPSENEDGYRESSVLEAAGDLKGKLLLIHGAMDENVHIQNTYQFADRLQRVGKQFDLMVYPHSRHSLSNSRQLEHMRRMMTGFILENL